VVDRQDGQGISPIKTLKGSDVSREGSVLRNHAKIGTTPPGAASR
jgi:hypothetical protein